MFGDIEQRGEIRRANDPPRVPAGSSTWKLTGEKFPEDVQSRSPDVTGIGGVFFEDTNPVACTGDKGAGF